MVGYITARWMKPPHPTQPTAQTHLFRKTILSTMSDATWTLVMRPTMTIMPTMTMRPIRTSTPAFLNFDTFHLQCQSFATVWGGCLICGRSRTQTRWATAHLTWDHRIYPQTCPAWVQHMTEVSHLMTVINCSVNFYIYLAKNSHFIWTTSSRHNIVSLNILVL